MLTSRQEEASTGLDSPVGLEAESDANADDDSDDHVTGTKRSLGNQQGFRNIFSLAFCTIDYVAGTERSLGNEQGFRSIFSLAVCTIALLLFVVVVIFPLTMRFRVDPVDTDCAGAVHAASAAAAAAAAASAACASVQSKGDINISGVQLQLEAVSNRMDEYDRRFQRIDDSLQILLQQAMGHENELNKEEKDFNMMEQDVLNESKVSAFAEGQEITRHVTGDSVNPTGLLESVEQWTENFTATERLNLNATVHVEGEGNQGESAPVDEEEDILSALFASCMVALSVVVCRTYFPQYQYGNTQYLYTGGYWFPPLIEIPNTQKY